jgi:hypothetical protein
VAQWADLHNAVAQAWVNADPTHGQYVDAWSKAHPDLVASVRNMRMQTFRTFPVIW